MVNPGIFLLSMTSFFLIGNIFWLFSLISQLFELIMTFFCHYCGKSFKTTKPLNVKFAIRIHKFKITIKIGTPVHKEMTLKSLVWHNSKRAGFVSPLDFRLRKTLKECWAHHYHLLDKNKWKYVDICLISLIIITIFQCQRSCQKR